MNKQFRVAIIGAGSRANQVIYPAFASLPDVRIEAICDIDETRLRETADRYGVAARYGAGVYDYRRMIGEIKPDAVVAIGQPHIFYDIWEWVLQNGYPLYIEKPLALTLHQAQMLTHLAETRGLATQVSFQRRQTPMVMQLRERCLARGPIVHAVCRFYKCDMTPMTGARDHMMDDCVHAIDTLRWICGGEVVGIESHTKRVGVPDINFIGATLHFDSGATGILLNSWSSGKRIFAVEMHSPRAFAEAEHETQGFLYQDGNLTPEVYGAQTSAGSDQFHIYTGVQNCARDFVDACRARTLPQSCFQDALKTMTVAAKILAQSALAQ